MSVMLAAQTPVLDECCHLGHFNHICTKVCHKHMVACWHRERSCMCCFLISQYETSCCYVDDGGGSEVQVRPARLTKHLGEKWWVSKDGVSEMLISTAVLPPTCWTAGSLPSLWLFNAGTSQAQTSWRREAFPLSVRKHRSSATSSLPEARLKHSQKNAGRPARLQDLSKAPLNSFYRKRKIQESGWEGRNGGEYEEGVKQSLRPWELFFYLFCTD